ncbi:MAG: putative peptidoglycan glycosyltransferase FtsW [Bacteroidota bacterium]
MLSQRRNHIDIVTLVAVLSLMVIGIGVVYSASSTIAMEKYGQSEAYLVRHLIKVVASLVALFFIIKIDYHRYSNVSKAGLFIAVGFLFATLALGGEIKGASRWLRLGGFGFQPSELAKFALILHLSVLMSQKKERIRDFETGFLPVAIWIALVTGLILLQPNFSTAMMLFLFSLIMLFVGGAKIKHIVLSLSALVPLLAIYVFSAEYRIRRVMAFFSGDHASSNYQLLQGIIGFGNGGLFGVGPGVSKQRDFFLPESYGDFVFSIVGEEYGYVGTVLLLFLFLIIFLRGLKIAKLAQDDLGKYLAIGITSLVTLYALVNAAVTLGLLPTTGLPMPFVSYGGSSMFFTACAIGVLLNISAQTLLRPRVEQVQYAQTSVDEGGVRTAY